jgi:NAD(P)-dependent dehydrogenase (short-subunit alcohol dehydrogenase family)
VNNSKVILITGASSGIGKASAEFLSRRGHTVYGTSRHAQPMPSPPVPLSPLATGEGEPYSFRMIQMDVNDDESVARGIRLILEQEKRLDVVVNNAGVSLVGPIEDASLDEAKSHFETNFFGVLRVCKAALPVMRQQGAGYIINISSIAGRAAAPYQGLYSAAKFAVEGLSEALRVEVRHFGIKVAMIEPGDSRTPLADHRVRVLRTPAYAEYYNNAIAVYEHDERNGYPPEKIGPLIERILQDPNPRLRYMCGMAFQTAGATLKSFVPHALFEWVLVRLYKF